MTKCANMRCSICGALMENAGPNRKYCTACKKDMELEWDISRIAGKRRKAVLKKEEAGILAVARKADELGLSYGQYVAKFEP